MLGLTKTNAGENQERADPLQPPDRLTQKQVGQQRGPYWFAQDR